MSVLVSESESSVSVRPPAENGPGTSPQTRTVWSRIKVLIRRVHLYTGLFLLPWVFLYGITGAMFNHHGLFPHVTIQHVPHSITDGSAMTDFPSAEELAQQVVQTLQAAANDASITLPDGHGAEFTNELSFEVHSSGLKHVIQIDPVSSAAAIVMHPRNPEEPEPLLTDLKNIRLNPDPHETARTAAAQILQQTGIQASGKPQPVGWTKLNFLAEVDGQPARITYVLKDGHVDVTRFTGQDGMPTRQFLLRLHTTHVQPPHWNGRMFWSLIVDVMAIAMVGWGLTGLFMWWQLRRTRLIGSVVIAFSLLTAAALYFNLHGFYATTKL